MIKPVVAMIVLTLGTVAPASAQEGGASGTAAQPPDQVQVFPRRPRAQPNGLAALLIDYPKLASRRREEGDVTMSMCVDHKGRVSDVRLVKSSGSNALDEASLKGVQKLRFQPGRDVEGKPADWCDPPYQLTLSWRLPPW